MAAPAAFDVRTEWNPDVVGGAVQDSMTYVGSVSGTGTQTSYTSASTITKVW